MNKYVQKIKSGIRSILIAYAILGSIYTLTSDTTGHHSSDIFLEKVQPTSLEKKIMGIK